MAQYKPTVDKKAAEQMNLTVLRRLDPAVEELLATAGHVALYDFDIPNKKWARKDVEGSLFLVKRRVQPRFQFIILNKKSADNFVEDVMGNFQCEVNKPYLLYRNKNNEVVGIWFYDDAECDKISALLQRIATTFAAPTAATLGSQANGASSAAAGTSAAGAAAMAAAPAASPFNASRAAAPPAWEVEGDDAAESAGADDGFWDHKVEVPAEVEMPMSIPTSSASIPLASAQHVQQAGPSGAPGPTPAAAVENSLLRIFAEMKLTPPHQQQQQQQGAAQQPQQQPFVATSPGLLPLLSPMVSSGLSLPAAAAADPTPSGGSVSTPTAAPAGAGAMPLLTPQYLKQQAAAVPPPSEGAGQTLLKQLQGRPAPPASATTTPATAAPLATVLPAPAAAAPAPAPPTVDLNEAAERVLHSKLRVFLRGLAENDSFVDIVISELRKAGLV